MYNLLTPDVVVSVFFKCGNMAREGLRVLVVSKKSLTEEQYQDFEVSARLGVQPHSALRLGCRRTASHIDSKIGGDAAA